MSKKKKQKNDPSFFSIFEVNDSIHACFQEEIKKIDNIVSDINHTKILLSRSKRPFGIPENIITAIDSWGVEEEGEVYLCYRDFMNSYNNILKMEKTVKNLESGLLFKKYTDFVTPILEEYKLILNTPMCKKNTEALEDRKSVLQDKYYKIASNFVEGLEIPTPKSIGSCDCGNTKNFEYKESTTTCKKCGLEMDIGSASQTSFRDVDRIAMHQTYKYEKKSHFKEGIAQYQGKQNKIIEDIVYERAQEWLEQHNFSVTKDDKDKQMFNKDHIRMFLQEAGPGFTKHYEDVHLIYSVLTKTPCADISHLEEKLYLQFDKIAEAFLMSGDTGRTNILSLQFILQNLLKLNGFKTSKQDFPGLKTDSRMKEHKELFEKLCEKAGIDYSLLKKKRT